jgi:hypothetical protein
MIEIGQTVTAIDGFSGLVTAHRGAPEGRIDHEVTSLEALPRRRLYREADLTPKAQEIGPFAVDSEVYVFGQRCRVLSHDRENDTYELFSLVELNGGTICDHWYPRVEGWEIELWNVGKP